MPKAVIRPDFKYVLFEEVYSRLESPKAQRRAFAITHAAIQCLARRDYDEVTLEYVAREAGVTRQALKKYFVDADDMKLVALKYIRLLFQKLALDATEKQRTPDKMLSAYVLACFHWEREFHVHAVAWYSFLQRCSRQPKLRAINSAAVRVGTDRITTLLEEGRALGVFHCTDCAQTARIIQLLITGGVLSSMSEDRENMAGVPETIERACLQLAQGR